MEQRNREKEKVKVSNRYDQVFVSPFLGGSGGGGGGGNEDTMYNGV